MSIEWTAENTAQKGLVNFRVSKLEKPVQGFKDDQEVSFTHAALRQRPGYRWGVIGNFENENDAKAACEGY